MHAIEVINSRRIADSYGRAGSGAVEGGAEVESGEALARTQNGGLFGLSGALFRHCAACIEASDSGQAEGESAKGRNWQVKRSPRFIVRVGLFSRVSWSKSSSTTGIFSRPGRTNAAFGTKYC